MAISLFMHAFFMVFTNIWDALRVSIVPFAIAAVISSVLIFQFGDLFIGIEAGSADDALTAIAVGFLIGFTLVVCSLWVAVAWHRFVLLEEFPGLLPAFRGQEMLRYFGAFFVLSMLVAIVLGLSTSIFGSMMAASTLHATVLGIAFSVLVLWLWARLSVVLPAAAIGQPMKFSQAWEATRDAQWSIFGALFLLRLVFSVLSISFSYLTTFHWVWLLPYFAIMWLSVMVGFSLLTAIHGVIVQKRPLP
ncbi:MAG: hypothetical protein JKX69_14235 [Rhodobacteraceae bacterium]|nr:hypothetical protein [Paracoccaceae bacterium]